MFHSTLKSILMRGAFFFLVVSFGLPVNPPEAESSHSELEWGLPSWGFNSFSFIGS